MGVDGLEKAKGNPDIHREDVQIWPEPAVEQRSKDGSRSKNHNFQRVRVLCSKAKGRGIFVVELMDMFVE
jgi:hypothetical protein